jgi:predicted ester cyclase
MVPNPQVYEQLQRPIDPAEYREIRELWKRHSIAEDARDLPGLISTLSEDCLYQVVPGGYEWNGHEGATRFYTQLLTSFPDIHFDLQNIVIGPQGVFEEARVTGTHQHDWLNLPATGEPVDFFVLIYFPWVPERRLFRGERVYVFANDELGTPAR